jgi:beta-phosphoglucomutase-like phosphatase (HAD superfamily)
MSKTVFLPGLGQLDPYDGWIYLDKCSDGLFKAGVNGVTGIVATGDSKVELIGFKEKTIAYVKSELGYPAYYPLSPTALTLPVKAVLMDLDGTTVRSEDFWIWIIERSIAALLGDKSFRLEEEDIPYVSGHSVSEHLLYCIQKYAITGAACCTSEKPTMSDALSKARKHYTELTEREMDLILAGKGRANAFTPTAGVKEFLLELKKLNIKIALVTSGLYRKAYPEIISAFDTLNMSDPAEFYDCIITGGFPPGEGSAGTLGELEAKPHPWLYAEACSVGLGIHKEECNHVIGIEDSAAGVCSVRLAGYYTIGMSGGNILKSGARGMCDRYCERLDDVLQIIKGGANE